MKVVQWYSAQPGIKVTATDIASRRVMLSGSVAAMQRAFGVRLNQLRRRERTYRGRTGDILVPRFLVDIVIAVLGLDQRQQAWPHASKSSPAAGASALQIRDVARMLGWPIDRSQGVGRFIAVIELGGGLVLDEFEAYFTERNLPRPALTVTEVAGGKNAPGGDLDNEVALDVFVAAAVAPGAALRVYFAPLTDDGFFTAVATAVHSASPPPDVLTISWGGAELTWSAQAMVAFDQLLEDAGSRGITVLCSAGDHGAGDRVSDGALHVQFPASSPHVAACGGTHVTVTGAIVTREVVWNDGNGWATGGGVSTTFDRPTWQADVAAHVEPTTRRALPDIAGPAGSAPGYLVPVHGRMSALGGTSGVAPLYAGLVALCNDLLDDRIGALAPVLYALPATAFVQVSGGNNSTPNIDEHPAVLGYAADETCPWNACTGLGRLIPQVALATWIADRASHTRES